PTGSCESSGSLATRGELDRIAVGGPTAGLESGEPRPGGDSTMRVLCGTDFSDRCEAAGTLGALLAKRSGGDLTLVHVLDTRSIALGPAPVLEALDQSARERLAQAAERLRELGARVSVELPAGWPDEALLAEAKRHDDALLILPA